MQLMVCWGKWYSMLLAEYIHLPQHTLRATLPVGTGGGIVGGIIGGIVSGIVGSIVSDGVAGDTWTFAVQQRTKMTLAMH